MLTFTLDALASKFSLEGETVGEVAAGAVLKHSRDFNLTRESRARLQARPADAGLRRPAGVRHRPGDDDPGREQDRPRPDRLRHRRRRRHHLRRADRRRRGPPPAAARAQPREVERRPAARAGEVPPPAADAGDPAQLRAAHRPVDGRAHARSWPANGGSAAPSRTSSPPRSHRNLAAAYDSGFLDDLVTPFLGLRSATRTSARTRASRSWPSSARCSAARTGR